MQLKHPELLWALLLLLIPIVIHLFQLRKFKRTPFTNVSMLQKVVSESRKSNQLKKWLLLVTRLGLLSCIVFAFAQPFVAEETALRKKETVIYIDDSFSMQAKAEGSTLLEKAVQELIKTIPEAEVFHFITNTTTIREASVQEVQNQLLGLEVQNKQLSLKDILIKAETLFSKDLGLQKDIIVISDLQKEAFDQQIDSLNEFRIHLVQLAPDNPVNVSIDSTYLGKQQNQQVELLVKLSGVDTDRETTIPLALYNDNTLIAKTAVEPLSNGNGEAVLSIPVDEKIKGRLRIDDNSLGYDNELYFSIDDRPQIKVLAIDDSQNDYLKRLFDNEEFEFVTTGLSTLNYGIIGQQDLIVLNDIETLPNSLVDLLLEHRKNGGALIIVPATEIDVPSYNSLLMASMNLRIIGESRVAQNVSNIAFGHPLFQNVFEKQVTNFDYPQVNQSYTVSGSSDNALSFSNGNGFLISKQNCYFFTGSLDLENSNFTGSPLIVPTFYNMALSSLQRADLYQLIGKNETVDISKPLGQDEIITLASKTFQFVPLQQNFNTKTRLSFIENPESAGIYAAIHKGDTLQHIAFNQLRTESVLQYQEIDNMRGTTKNRTITDLFEKLNNDNRITDYWKWFIIFALVFLLLEILIQKYLT